MKLEEIDVSKLIPLFMRADRDTLALSEVISETLQPLAAEISKLSTWGQLARLNTGELDTLAEELAVLWYDRTLSDDQKRVLIANSDKVYMHLGTKSAVQDVVKDIFGNAAVEEWYSYGGSPHYFRINVNDSTAMTPENEAKLMRVLDYVKRKSQWLESIQNNILTSWPLNVGMSVAVHAVLNVRVDVWQEHTTAAGIYAGASTVTHV